MFWIIIASFAILITVAIVIYMMPSEQAAESKKKIKAKKDRETLMADSTKPLEPSKDWKGIAERWEKNNNALLGDLEKIKMQEKTLLKSLEEQKQEVKGLIDKLSLEKSWREKEQINSDKSRQHEKDLKDQTFRTEKDLEKEHSERLRLERELQEIKIKHDAIAEEKRSLSTKAMSLETTLNLANKENRELKIENMKLKEKREDIQWVAKSQYDELKKQFEQLKSQNPV